ncbi:MAG: LysR family transcriptional regulator [Sulfuriferula sp.]
MLHLTLRQLKIYEAVARNLSYSRAARELHLTQPAVSMQIKLLEESLGLPLFEKLGKKIYLTEAGHEMYRYSRTIAEQLVEAELVLAELKGMERGNLRISVASTANYFATQLLASFRQMHPQVTLNLDVTNREALLNQLDQNEIDLAIMGQPPDGYDLIAESFMENPLVVIAAPDNPLAGQKNIPISRLAEETLIVREEGSGTRSASERFFQSHQIAPLTGLVMNTNEAIKQSVQAGMGLAVVSLHTVSLELETKRLALLDVAFFPIQRYWFIVHRKNKRLSATAQAFKQFLLDEGKVKKAF